MRQGIMTHNPFLYAKGKPDNRPHVEAKFEKRARIERQIEAIDKDIAAALRRVDLSPKSFERLEDLTARRNRLSEELP